MRHKEQDDEILLAERVRDEGLNRKHLRQQDLRRLMHSDFSSRRAVEGLYSGRHKTRQRGQSIEFHDYRQYIPGDPVNHVDWKVYARSDRLFIKLFEHQADLTVHLLVDGSRSMKFSGFELDRSKDSKFDCSCRLAAAIGFLIARQRDRFSFNICQDGLQDFGRPASTMSHLMNVLEHMESFVPHAAAGFGKGIETLLHRSKKRDLLCVFSDLLDEPTELLEQVAIWLRRGGEAIVFHVLHDDELELPKSLKSGSFVDSESGQRIQIDPAAIANDYRNRMNAFTQQSAEDFKQLGVDYNLVKVQSHFAVALEKYFARRTDRLSGRAQNRF